MYLCDNYDSTHCLILERQVTKYLGMTVHTLSLFSFHIHRSGKGRFPKITSVVTVYINGRCRGLGWNSDVGVLIPRTSGRDLAGTRVFTKGVQFKTRVVRAGPDQQD